MQVLIKVKNILNITREVLDCIKKEKSKKRREPTTDSDEFASTVEELLKRLEESKKEVQDEMNRLLDQADNDQAMPNSKTEME